MLKKFILTGVLALLMAVILACGGEDEATPAPDQGGSSQQAASGGAAPATQAASGSAAVPATSTPSASGQTAPATSTPVPVSADLRAIAAQLSGGPGAIYVGDLNQLVGPVPEPISGDIGDYDGVPYEGLEDYLYVFDSDYYRKMIEQANYTNPTEVTTTGMELSYQFACINRALTHCKLAEWWSDQVYERTNGQLKIEIIGYPELGIAGPDVLELLANGTLSFAELPAAYTAGDLPAMDMKYLWGMYKDNETFYKATAAAIPDLDRLIEERTGGGITIFQLWRVPENEIFFFTKDPIEQLDDFQGLKVRSFGGALSDMIDGMGSEAQWVAFSEVYTALERGILDGGVTGANAAYGQRWYEVADYMAGPLPLFTVENATFNADVWAELPDDFRQILLEEGAKYELEFFRVTPILSQLGIPKLLDEGMTYIPFSDEIRDYMFEEVALKRVIPQWVNRVGGADTEAVRLFNKNVGPVAGILINPDGTASLTDPPAAPSGTGMAMNVSPELQAVADELAGGPGSIYVGDLSQLVGPSPGGVEEALGDGTGNVPLEFLERNKHIFETDYYHSLLDKAKLTNPTPLTSSGEKVNIQYACINRALLPCVLQTVYFAENVKERTNGQVNFEVSSYPELGLAGSDMLELVEQGTIEFAQIQPAYVGGTWPLIDIIYVWGLWKDFRSEHEANTQLLDALDQGIYDNTGGGKLIYHIWYGGNDQYFFSNRGAELEDFDGLKTRSHGTTMTDAINGLGGEGQFMAFAEVYTALERGILDAGVTGAHAGHGQRWYEVTDNLIGPFISMPMGFETMNVDTWERIPADLQAIIIEEGAKMELENLRLAAVWNETGVKVNVDAGMTFLPWSDEMKEFVYSEVALGRVLPNWIKRVGPDEVALWNEIVAPWAKVEIEADYSVDPVEFSINQIE